MERVRDGQGVQDAVAIQEAVWGQDFSWLGETLSRTRSQRLEEVSVYCAYSDAHPVGTGWIEYPVGSRFAELHGGAVLAEMRGRGIYSALFQARLEEARRRGVEFLAVDAAPMSRPILQRKGFMQVCHTYPLRRAASAL